ncbi:M20 family metallopeptidase [Deinococcus peraridilitoris]|nr:M20/M25/M40 family metallo-hydrolase [Deinococcus peraridilitoris]
MPNATDFLRDLIRVRAMPGQEQELAERVRQEWRELGFDEAYTDEAGNALGLVRGRETGNAWLLLTHLDHVHEGDLSLWKHPPFEAVLEEGIVYGRGAVDIKGPLAAQTYALADLLARGERPRRDVWIAAVTEEEVGGAGAAYLVAHPPALIGAVIVGEPSNNQLMLGHRGVAHVHVTLHGTAHHASLRLPDNPLFALGELLRRVEHIDLPTHPVVGRSTLTPTQVVTDSGSENLTSNTATVTLDWRGSESEEQMRATLTELLAGLPASGEVAPMWTAKNTPGFATDPAHPLVAKVLPYTRRFHTESGLWSFATDGRYTHAASWPTVGWGPGDEKLAHTVREAIAVADLQAHAAALGELLVQEAP